MIRLSSISSEISRETSQGEGGLITFSKSRWLASIVLPHQPHFIGLPEDVYVFWGDGLRVDQPRDFVLKPMSAWIGR
jgi:oleate hydratase